MITINKENNRARVSDDWVRLINGVPSCNADNCRCCQVKHGQVKEQHQTERSDPELVSVCNT